MDRLPSHTLVQSWELMLMFEQREVIDLGCLLGRLFVTRHWLRKSTFALAELLPLSANRQGLDAPVCKAFSGYRLKVRSVSVCWHAVHWVGQAGYPWTSWCCRHHQLLRYTGQSYQAEIHDVVGAKC